MVRIAVDLAGSEKGAAEVVSGARMAQASGDVQIILVGPRPTIDLNTTGFSFRETPSAIPMGEKVSREVLRNPGSSLYQIVQMVKEGKADAAVSGGNTACFVALATTMLGLIPGVERPGIAIFLPKMSGSTILIDAGANVNAIPEHLRAYAVLGSHLYRTIFKNQNPKVGLLNVGAEESKGNDFYRATHLLLKKESRINFAGNIEGQDIFSPRVDVVVVDGFTGNCILKASEGVAEDFATFLKQAVAEAGLQDSRTNEVINSFCRRANFEQHSGGFLMGVSGVCIIIHGRSAAEATKNGILRAKEAVSCNLISNLQMAV